MKINEALKFGYEILRKNGIDSFVLDCELLLSFVLKKKREWILANPEFLIHKRAEKRFFKLLIKRVKNYPIAYILGYKYFFGKKFKVNKNVLIPRPETEILVDEIIKLNPKDKTILDVGTGSGCIAISLANTLQNIKIIASDISKKALRIAKKNARINKARDIEFIYSDLLKNIKEKGVDIIVANLPYVKKDYNNDSIKYEPKSALYSYSKDGLSYYKKLLHQIKEFEFSPKYIFFEINPEQAPILEPFVKQIFRKPVIEIKKDLAGLDRIFIIKFVM